MIRTDNIEVITHSCIRIRTESGTVYFDPFHMKEKPHDADYILITHDHYDHFSPEDIAGILKTGTVVIVPEGMKEKAEKELPGGTEIAAVKPGESCQIGELEFETIASYNRFKPFHPKSAGWVGYVLKTEGLRIYVAGDTDATREAEQVKCDIALVPVGGTYTMNASQAAALINTIQPSAAIPTHYGSVVGTEKDAEVFRTNVSPSVAVEIKMQTR